jgi:hypothetical protein
VLDADWGFAGALPQPVSTTLGLLVEYDKNVLVGGLFLMNTSTKQQWFTITLGVIATIGTLIGAIAAIRVWYQIDIESFSVDPAIINQGERVRLDWKVENVSKIEIRPNIGTVNSIGSRTDAPVETTVYLLVAKKLLFTKEAEFEVLVKPVAGRPKPETTTIDFSGLSKGRFLKGNEFNAEGISEIKASPIGAYCKNAQAAILPPGSYRSNYSFLTTAQPGQLMRCNGVPLAIYFGKPAKEVIVHFFGADVPYKLEAYRIDGTAIGHETARARPYEYSDFEIRITSEEADIASITFGYTAALTMIRDVQVVR